MAAGRSLRSLLNRRRRPDEEGEDDDGPEVVDDSHSDNSALSDIEDEGSDVTSVDAQSAVVAESKHTTQRRTDSPANGSKKAKRARTTGKVGSRKAKNSSVETTQTRPAFGPTPDTETMTKAAGADDQLKGQKALEFEDVARQEAMLDMSDVRAATAPARPTKAETMAERQRRDQADYQRKRDSDPAFIPNRGTFFMHDTRGRSNGQNSPPVRGAWQGRGRGRGGAGVGGPFSPAAQLARSERAAEPTWKHDLHETVNEGIPDTSNPSFKPNPAADNQSELVRNVVKPNGAAQSNSPLVVSFSSTTLVGKVQIRVFLPGVVEPMVFPDVPWRHHTRLPDHRPPLRRDKPVRISLPGHGARYIFPTTDRSFIFIPRQMRPNQQNIRRGYQRSIGGQHGYSSRRTSIYGGSIYSGSVAASRRSSFTGVTRENAFSPVGSLSGMPQSARPVVRLPYGGHHFPSVSTSSGPMSGQHTPINVPQHHTYSLPQQPTYQGTPTTTVHQPQPQKAISVTGIESPVIMQQHSSQSIEPFQNQLAELVNDPINFHAPQGHPPAYFASQQPYSYPRISQNGTPLSGIPEQAIHAPSFQPTAPANPAQPPYYGMYQPAQQQFYYPPGMNGYPPSVPMFVPPQGYGLPPSAPSGMAGATAEHITQRHDEEPNAQPAQSSQSGMVAHESNGMVFYLPAAEAQQSDQYHPAESFVPSYAMPGLQPSSANPEVQMPYYYPPMPPMQDMGAGSYYPTAQ